MAGDLYLVSLPHTKLWICFQRVFSSSGWLFWYIVGHPTSWILFVICMTYTMALPLLFDLRQFSSRLKDNPLQYRVCFIILQSQVSSCELSFYLLVRDPTSFLSLASVFRAGLSWWLSWLKKCAWNTGDLGSIPGLGRSPGEGKGYPLQYSGLENSMDCIIHGVAKSRTRLNDFHFHFLC